MLHRIIDPEVEPVPQAGKSSTYCSFFSVVFVKHMLCDILNKPYCDAAVEVISGNRRPGDKRRIERYR